MAQLPLPTPPASKHDWSGPIIGASAAQTDVIRRSLCWLAPRDPRTLAVITSFTVFPESDREHFDHPKVPVVIAHFHPDTRGICFLDRHVIFKHVIHEFDHANTWLLEQTPEGRNALAHWDALILDPYGIKRYPEPTTFPHKTFLSRHSTHDADEHRAEWYKYIILLLAEIYLREKRGTPKTSSNPIRTLDKEQTIYRRILAWFFEQQRITEDDYIALTPWFQ